MHFPNPGIGLGGFGFLGGVFTDILAGLVFIVCFVVVVGVLFILIRFLLVATRAAEIYVAKNSAERPSTNAAPSAPAATANAATTRPAATATPKPATTTASKPATRTSKPGAK